MGFVMTDDPIARLLGEGEGTSILWIVLIRIALSVVLTAMIGYERSTKRHSAGLRTFIIVSLACTIAMLLDLYLDRGFCLLSAAALVGLATITVNSIVFSSRSRIKGLTTSVGLWASGIIGLTVGAGFYTVTLVSFVALLFVLSWFPKLEIYLKNRSNHFDIHLELKNVSFTYEDSEKPALEGVDLRIRAGERIAIVGHNGAGKSTLIKLLLRLYDPTDGSILINGEPIGNYRLSSYRNLFGSVFQDYQLFAASVAENVLLDECRTDVERARVEDFRISIVINLSSLRGGW